MSPEEVQARLRGYPLEDGSGDRAVKHAEVQVLVEKVALRLCELVPNGREQSLMMTHLEDALMWANKGIARWG